MASQALITEVDDTVANVHTSFNVDAFDDFVNAHGAEFTHFRALRCPIGLTGLYDNRQTHDDHIGCSNGFIYKAIGKVNCVFSNSGDKEHQKPNGIVDGSRAIISINRMYNGTETPAQLANFDRLYLSESAVTVVNWELFEAHQTGIDKLKFPIEEIEHIMDSNGIEYTQNDFDIKDGRIIWGKKRPGVQFDGKGTVCTARYTYRPYWYISNIIHESRFAKIPDKLTGVRKIVRFPYQCEIQREYYFENERKDDQTPISARQVLGPANGSFGSR